ncbi:MAG: dTDP-4-amino-4,6-dideoxygalactose transaminase [Bacteroidetes bacterium GWF2_38_335]|nr:MAG: dTDP-4-amino-4,6-dideoxygalactose transaminase [Bacteroidetes bacterium GWF2_38_335]OFY77057.1 MAG: dTDP-4-amino-4,6-dideoxygalactose transaminase [Bacteroidetes bacterium RIFOXYA12_FULL_38_20]HBS86803.1 dTDP-4-amino-4,6-dideoxygalactose transaminase [Bacteroidales bacterium]
MLPLNKPYLSGNELYYIEDALKEAHISGNGKYTKKCHGYFKDKYGFKKTLLTTSCTDALEMCAILLDIKNDDEVILPSFTFVSTALAFYRQGAKLVFADCRRDFPSIDESKIEDLITPKTKAIVVVHYAGISCNMDMIMKVAEKYNLFVIEDAAQSFNSFYKTRPLGGIGHLGCMSFHETKNIQCGEGGMLIINDNRFVERSEIIWEKGTNRAKFFRGEINKYGWVDTGSSFLPSELNAAFLFAQLEMSEIIQDKRLKIWNKYFNEFKKLKLPDFDLPLIPEYASQNGHLFYIVLKNKVRQQKLINFLREKDIYAAFHYLPLHQSEFYKKRHDGRKLNYCDKFSDCLVRLPLFFELTDKQQSYIISTVVDFFKTEKR